MNILVSACLIGLHCRYDGRAAPCASVLALARRHKLIPICPECLGGLSTPRRPAEIKDGVVRTSDGADVTAAYLRGAEAALSAYKLNACEAAILKARSPSCGKGLIYDGSFSGRLTGGDGVTARALIDAGCRVLTEDEANSL